MNPVRIPSHRPSLGQEELSAVERVFESRWLGTGPATEAFEKALRERLGVRHAIAVNSGTAALHLALESLALSPGDEVILPSMTFVSTAQAVLAARARPVFCEVRHETLNINVEDAARRITPRTKAILPVHYGGRVCEMDALREIARRHRLFLIEDAAHAFGSELDGRPAGTLGDFGCFSFDPIKNITCGSGGALITDNDALAARVRTLCNVGIDIEPWRRIRSSQPWLYEVVTPGFRYRMSDINASIGLVQLERFEEFRERKRCIAQRYDAAFAGMPGLTPIRHDVPGVFPFNYVIRVREGKRDALMARLKERGIGSTVQFTPCHLQPVFEPFREALPATEQLYGEILTLPLYVEMSGADVEYVIGAVRSFLQESEAS